MTCRQVRKLLSRYVDGELGPEVAEQVTAHSRTCAACGEELQAFMQLASLVVESGPEVRASAGFADRVLREVRARSIRNPKSEIRNPKSARRPFPTWMAFGAAVILVVLLIWGVRSVTQRPDLGLPERAVVSGPHPVPPPVGTGNEGAGRLPTDSGSGLNGLSARPGGGNPLNPLPKSVDRAHQTEEGKRRDTDHGSRITDHVPPHHLTTSPPHHPLRLARAVGPGLERCAPGDTAMRPAPAGSVLHAHDLLRTSAGVVGEITLNDGSRVKLSENTSLRLRPEGLMLYDGALWVQAEPQPTPLCVRTPTGVSVEVVGTEFLVAFSRQTTQTTVAVLKGTVRIRRAEEAVMVRASEQCVVNPTAPPSPPQAVEVAALAAWATGTPAEPPSPSSLIPHPSSLTDFEVSANAPAKVFSTTQQPCTFTLRLRNQSDGDRPLDLTYQLTDLTGTVVQEGQESAVAPARAAWEKPLSISIARNGLYTLLLTVQSGETTLEQSLDFAVEGEENEQD